MLAPGESRLKPCYPERGDEGARSGAESANRICGMDAVRQAQPRRFSEPLRWEQGGCAAEWNQCRPPFAIHLQTHAVCPAPAAFRTATDGWDSRPYLWPPALRQPPSEQASYHRSDPIYDLTTFYNCPSESPPDQTRQQSAAPTAQRVFGWALSRRPSPPRAGKSFGSRHALRSG